MFKFDIIFYKSYLFAGNPITFAFALTFVITMLPAHTYASSPIFFPGTVTVWQPKNTRLPIFTPPFMLHDPIIEAKSPICASCPTVEPRSVTKSPISQFTESEASGYNTTPSPMIVSSKNQKINKLFFLQLSYENIISLFSNFFKIRTN